MISQVWSVATVALSCGLCMGNGPRIEGIVVSGTRGEAPVANAEVILRVAVEDAMTPAAKTVTDEHGRFVFANLPDTPGLVYLPGANHQGIHYPGPRLQLDWVTASARVKLVVYDTVTSPSPLVAKHHKIDVEIQDGILEITETVMVSNPSNTTYVGESEEGQAAATLALSIPESFERVTFHDEFHGRHFRVVNKQLVTDIPWTPGEREVKYTYHLSSEGLSEQLEWLLNLPCERASVRVHGKNAKQLVCSLPTVTSQDEKEAGYESSGEPLPAGQVISLRLGSLSTPWITHARWGSIVLLGSSIVLTVGYRRFRSPKTKPPTLSNAIRTSTTQSPANKTATAS